MAKLAAPLQMTVAKKLLVSAWLIAQGDTEARISLSRLAVVASRRWPEAFSFEDMGEHYPDIKRVSSELAHQNGVVKNRKWLAIAGMKTWRLTELGAKVGRKLWEATK